MKKLLVFIFILCFAVPELPAQRCLSGMQGLQITTGIAPDNGFHSGIAFSQYSKSANKWVFGAEYLEKRHPYKDIKIPQSQFTVDAGYYLKILSDLRKTFFVSVGASGMVGYETINRSEKLLFDGATINSSDAFLYGGILSLESEIYLTDRVIFLVHARERLLMGSTVGNFYPQLGLGIKFIIN